MLIITDLKNGGTCFDNGGNDEFSCNCVDPYAGNECQTEICGSVCEDCQNGGICLIEVIGGIVTPRCDCSSNFEDGTLQCLAYNLTSNVNWQLPCYNGACGGTDNAICQCNQENGKAKYYGENCDMPVACNGNPCQNGGECTATTQANDTQDCSIINLLYFFHKSLLKPCKAFECSCVDGFDGIFCEYKLEADHLLFISTTVNDFENRFNDKLVFDLTGRLVDESASIGENSGAYRSCSTMVNGEAVIFGGNHKSPTNITRQVNIGI